MFILNDKVLEKEEKVFLIVKEERLVKNYLK